MVLCMLSLLLLLLLELLGLLFIEEGVLRDCLGCTELIIMELGLEDNDVFILIVV